jgi:type IV pilus assembly protein PilQ
LEGSKVAIAQLIYFIRQIDKSVPVVMIEVLIVDYIKSRGLDVGIDMGLAEDVIESSGELFPSLNTVKGAASLNQLIDAFDGFGALNIGSVVPNFYVNIKAMESNGVLDIRSTPILTTLNGQEASLSIGNTEYYVVETNNLIGTQNPQSQNTRNWKSVKAELSVKITPNISADSNVTLAIEVNQSNFTNRIEPDAPPGQVSRTFNSLIRVKDGDMILLGGLEELKKEDTNKGVPLLSRIPILKWFFSSKVKANSDKKLNIFIKPTIIG